MLLLGWGEAEALAGQVQWRSEAGAEGTLRAGGSPLRAQPQGPRGAGRENTHADHLPELPWQVS